MTMGFSVVFAGLITAILGLAYLLSWVIPFIIFFILCTLLLEPIVREEMEYGKPDFQDIIEGIQDAVLEDEEPSSNSLSE
jgi:hypothetical protein